MLSWEHRLGASLSDDTPEEGRASKNTLLPPIHPTTHLWWGWEIYPSLSRHLAHGNLHKTSKYHRAS